MNIIWKLISRYLAGKISVAEFANSFDAEFRKCLKIHRTLSHYFHGVHDEAQLQIDLAEIREGADSPQGIVSMQAFQIVNGVLTSCLIEGSQSEVIS